MPYFEPSRPMPDCLTPPNGATSVERMPSLTADHAVFQRLGDAEHAADVAGVEVGGEAELGVVGEADRLGLVREPGQRGDRAEDLLARDGHVGRDVREHGRLEEGAARGHGDGRRPSTLAPAPTASASRRSTFSTASMLISGPCATPSSAPSPTFIARTRAASFSAKASWTLVLDQEAVRAHAGLAHVAVLRGQRALDRGVEVGVVEDDERRIAAQLQRHLLHRRGALGHQLLADRRSSR